MVWVLVLLNQPGRINFHQPVMSIHCRYPAPGRIPGLVISLVVLLKQPGFHGFVLSRIRQLRDILRGEFANFLRFWVASDNIGPASRQETQAFGVT